MGYMECGIWVPFLGTIMGAGLAFLLPRDGGATRNLSGLSAGAMLASAVWSLLLPGMERGQLPTGIGFTLGMLLLLLPERVLERQGKHLKSETLLLLAVVLHNIPEGLAVGAGYAGFLGEAGVPGREALALALGIAVQNLPDGAVAVIPLIAAGVDRRRAFLAGVLTGAVEPLAAALVAFAPVAGACLSGFMGFAAGTMVYVVIRELIPQMGDGPAPTVLFTAGFLLLMVLALH